jgi:hypothetical protein
VSEPSWQTSHVVEGRDAESGDAVPVVVGLWESAAGRVQVVLRVGDDRRVILALQDAGQLELNVRAVLAERFRLTIGTLGGEDR